MKTVLIFALLFASSGIRFDSSQRFGERRGDIRPTVVWADQPDLAIRVHDYRSTDGNVAHWHAEKPLYWLLSWIFSSSVYFVRLPAILVGAATVLVFYKWAGIFAGPRAALLAAVSLATDPTFLLLTDTFDWGPAALQHLLVISGCLLIARGV